MFPNPPGPGQDARKDHAPAQPNATPSPANKIENNPQRDEKPQAKG